MSDKSSLGTIGWFDLTVKNAKPLSQFFADVVGWGVEETPVDEYSMTHADTGHPLSGICHQKGQNVGIPSQWLIYVYADNIEERSKKIETLGGTIIKGPSEPSSNVRFTIFRDPQGAVMFLFEAATKT